MVPLTDAEKSAEFLRFQDARKAKETRKFGYVHETLDFNGIWVPVAWCPRYMPIFNDWAYWDEIHGGQRDRIVDIESGAVVHGNKVLFTNW